MSKWNVSVGMRLNIDYDDIEAETKEEAEEIALDRAREDIDFNNCECGEPIVYCCWKDDGEEDDEEEEEECK